MEKNVQGQGIEHGKGREGTGVKKSLVQSGNWKKAQVA